MGKKTRSKTRSKTMKKYSKTHKHSIHHRRSKRRYNHNHSIHHRPRLNRRRHSREISVISVPGSKSVSLFAPTNKKRADLIRIGEKQSIGNIVPGLRNYLKNI